MQMVVTAAQMQYYDRSTTEQTGISSLLLMERAALAMAGRLEAYLAGKQTQKKPSIAVLAGTGNNGGDGLAAGRIMAMKGYPVTFYVIGELSKTSPEMQKQMEIIKRAGFSIQSNLAAAEYDVVIDALFGIGLKREVTGIWREAVEYCNACKSKGAFVLSADIPSGISADTGKILGYCVEADLTVTFGYAKAGHCFYPGKYYTGERQVEDIGISYQRGPELPPSYRMLEPEDITALLPERKPWGNKGTFGKVLLAAGSRGMGGAAILCAASVLRAGAGMVKVLTPACNREILQTALPEAILEVYEEEPEPGRLKEAMDWADVLAIGPGLGMTKGAHTILNRFLQDRHKRLVIDADGLNLLAREEQLRQAIRHYEAGKIVLTPHPGELMRLAGISREAYQEDPSRAVRNLAEHLSCVAVGKDAVTLTAAPFDRTLFLNPTGNDGMATAGSGDVLTGLLAGLLAQAGDTGSPEEEAQRTFFLSAAGAWIHGAAGDRAACRKGHRGMTAQDISENIGEVLKEMTEKRGN